MISTKVAKYGKRKHCGGLKESLATSVYITKEEFDKLFGQYKEYGYDDRCNQTLYLAKDMMNTEYAWLFKEYEKEEEEEKELTEREKIRKQKLDDAESLYELMEAWAFGISDIIMEEIEKGMSEFDLLVFLMALDASRKGDLGDLKDEKKRQEFINKWMEDKAQEVHKVYALLKERINKKEKK